MHLLRIHNLHGVMVKLDSGLFSQAYSTFIMRGRFLYDFRRFLNLQSKCCQLCVINHFIFNLYFFLIQYIKVSSFNLIVRGAMATFCFIGAINLRPQKFNTDRSKVALFIWYSL